MPPTCFKIPRIFHNDLIANYLNDQRVIECRNCPRHRAVQSSIRNESLFVCDIPWHSLKPRPYDTLDRVTLSFILVHPYIESFSSVYRSALHAATEKPWPSVGVGEVERKGSKTRDESQPWGRKLSVHRPLSGYGCRERDKKKRRREKKKSRKKSTLHPRVTSNLQRVW